MSGIFGGLELDGPLWETAGAANGDAILLWELLLAKLQLFKIKDAMSNKHFLVNFSYI